jgi:hypothetical protein
MANVPAFDGSSIRRFYFGSKRVGVHTSRWLDAGPFTDGTRPEEEKRTEGADVRGDRCMDSRRRTIFDELDNLMKCFAFYGASLL